MNRIGNMGRCALSVTLSFAFAVSAMPMPALAEVAEYGRAVATQSSNAGCRFEVDSIELYVGETKEVRILDCDDLYSCSTPLCVCADESGGTLSIQGICAGSGTIDVNDDEATMHVTVKNRPAGYTFASGTSDAVTWGIKSDAASADKIVLTIGPAKGAPGSLESWTCSEEVPWDAYRRCITKVAIKPGVTAPSCTSFFYDMRSLRAIEGLDNLDTSQATSMADMFGRTYKLREIDVSGIDTARVEDMSGMFEMSGVEKLQLSHFDTSNVTSMFCMFNRCGYLNELDVSGFDTSNVKDMNSMFRGCDSLFGLDLSAFNTGNVTDMSDMFSWSEGLDKLDISNFDTSSVTCMDGMFDHVDATELVLSDDFVIKADEDQSPLPDPEGEDVWVDSSSGEELSTAELIELYTRDPRDATWVAKDTLAAGDDDYDDDGDSCDGDDGTSETEPAGALDDLGRELASALDGVAAAEQELKDAQTSYDEAKKTYDSLDGDIKAAEADKSEKKAALDAAAEKLEEAKGATKKAQAAVDKNASDIEAAQNAVTAAEQATSGTAVTDAEQRVSAAQASVDAAQVDVDAAQAAISAETADPGTNEGHKEWTAYGLFQSIRDGAVEGSAAYWDAQCAMDILDGGINTTGYSYYQYEGPVPNGKQASAMANISENIDWSSRSDAISLDNIKTSLAFIDEYNQYRAKENADEGYSLTTNVGTNCRLMAIAAVQLDYAKDRYTNQRSHSKAYHVGENLSWGYSDPFAMWYDGEKANFESGSSSNYGHYMNIVDHLPLNSENPTAATGFAVNTEAAGYGVAHGQVFHTTSGYSQYNPTITYSTSEFSGLVNNYYDAQVAAGMFGTTADVRAQHQQALSDAEAVLQDAQAELSAAKETLAAAQNDSGNAAAELEEARNHLASLQGETATLQSALSDATQAQADAQQTYDSANQAYEAAKASLENLDPDGSYAQAEAALADAKKELDQKKQDLVDAKAAASKAQEAIDAFTDLSTSEAIKVVGAKDAYFTGAAIMPAVTVSAYAKNGDKTELKEGTDYKLEYRNNTNVGSATILIKGTGDKGSGTWWGTKTVSFKIFAREITGVGLAASGCTYDGNAHKPAVDSVTSGTLTLPASAYTVTYKRGGKATTDFRSAGTISVVVSGTGNYAGQKTATFTIAKAPSSIALAGQSKAYTGKALSYDGKVTRAGSTGKVTYEYFSDSACKKAAKPADVKNAGTYYVRATLAADGNHKAAKSGAAKFVIKKAANPMKVTSVERTVKFKSLKKKSLEVARPMSVSGNQGALSYAKAGGSSKLSVNSKTGKVTVKKGTKKGTYKVKIKVTAKGSGNYESGVKTVTCKVVVK